MQDGNDVYLEIKLFHTGYYYYTSYWGRELLDKIWDNGKNIASISYKINNYDLLNNVIEKNKKLEIAEKI